MEATSGSSTPRSLTEPANPRRRRRGTAAERVRYFLPKTGSSKGKA